MRRSMRHLSILTLAGLCLAGCDAGTGLTLGGIFQPRPDSSNDATGGSDVKTVERDIEAPEVFEANEPGLWDGRPSLGGVWVAHPDVTDPERVIIRNTANDAFVVGALFRRERDIPGPRLQISSDAAEALKILAGAPANLSVIALRKEIVAVQAEQSETLPAPDAVQTATLDPIAGAAAVLGEEDAASVTTTAPVEQSSSLSKPFIQIGIFSVEANARRSATQMRSAGLLPTIKPGARDGKPFWRVVVGPAATSAERATLLKQIKAEGFSDAYAVTN